MPAKNSIAERIAALQKAQNQSQAQDGKTASIQPQRMPSTKFAKLNLEQTLQRQQQENGAIPTTKQIRTSSKIKNLSSSLNLNPSMFAGKRQPTPSVSSISKSDPVVVLSGNEKDGLNLIHAAETRANLICSNNGRKRRPKQDLAATLDRIVFSTEQ